MSAIIRRVLVAPAAARAAPGKPRRTGGGAVGALAAEGDLPASKAPAASVYDATLADAVKRFERRHGLVSDGALAARRPRPAIRHGECPVLPAPRHAGRRAVRPAAPRLQPRLCPRRESPGAGALGAERPAALDPRRDRVRDARRPRALARATGADPGLHHVPDRGAGTEPCASGPTCTGTMRSRCRSCRGPSRRRRPPGLDRPGWAA
jgi:hypothetical protein